MPPDPPRGSGLWPSILQGTCLLTSQCPSTSKVNENPVAYANDMKIVRSGDVQCNTEESPLVNTSFTVLKQLDY